MSGDAAAFILAPFSRLWLLLADVLLDAVVQHRADAEGHILLDQRPDRPVVLAGHKLAVKRHLHELVEGSPAEDRLAQIHYLNGGGGSGSFSVTIYNLLIARVIYTLVYVGGNIPEKKRGCVYSLSERGQYIEAAT